MDSKLCGTCQITQPIEQFSLKNSQTGKHSAKCKNCMQAYCSAHYRANKDYYRAKSREGNARAIAKAKEFLKEKKNVPCADCKKSYPDYVMDFDHVSGNKVGNIANMVNKNSIQTIAKEIEKCELVCANCHRIRTYNRLWSAEKKAETVAYHKRKTKIQ